jgi:hypothetical protein
LPDDGFVLSQWDLSKRKNVWGAHDELIGIRGGEYQQWFIISEPGHPFLEAVILKVLDNIANYDRRVHGVGKLGVLRTTGPIPYTLEIHKILDRHKHRFMASEANGLMYERTKSIDFGAHYSELTEDVVL